MNNSKDVIFKGIFETALDAIITIDESGIIQAFNPAAEKLFGYIPKEIIGLNIKILMPAHYAKHHDDYLKTYLDTGQRKIIGIGRNVEGKRKDGTTFPMHLSVNEAKVNQKRIFIGFARDISTQVKSESSLKAQNDKLETLNKELESFSYSVSHDLTAPLRHITGYIELLKEHISNTDDPKVKKYIEVINSEAARMHELMQSLLNLSRLGRASLNKSTVPFNELVNTVITFFKPDIATREIEWQIEPLPEVLCDKEMLALVWENLISNALKFTSNTPKTSIKIGYSKQGAYHQFSIQDNGVGFEPSQTNKLFNVFQRLHSQSEFKGTGIGLVNIKKIVEKHNGKIWIEGALNKGATVYFTLPI